MIDNDKPSKLQTFTSLLKPCSSHTIADLVTPIKLRVRRNTVKSQVETKPDRNNRFSALARFQDQRKLSPIRTFENQHTLTSRRLSVRATANPKPAAKPINPSLLRNAAAFSSRPPGLSAGFPALPRPTLILLAHFSNAPIAVRYTTLVARLGYKSSRIDEFEALKEAGATKILFKAKERIIQEMDSLGPFRLIVQPVKTVTG